MSAASRITEGINELNCISVKRWDSLAKSPHQELRTRIAFTVFKFRRPETDKAYLNCRAHYDYSARISTTHKKLVHLMPMIRDFNTAFWSISQFTTPHARMGTHSSVATCLKRIVTHKEWWNRRNGWPALWIARRNLREKTKFQQYDILWNIWPRRPCHST